MAKTYRFDPDEYGGGRDYQQAKNQAKKKVKFEKRRSDRREFDDRADDQEQNRR